MEKGVGMATIDGWLEGFLHGPAALWVILLVSLALGLRHASDPDHLAAVTTLIASEKDGGGARKAGFMGFSWGLGHGTSLFSSAFRSYYWDVTCRSRCSELRRL